MPAPRIQFDQLPEQIALQASLTLDAAGGTFEMDAYDGGLLHVGEYPLPVVVDLKGLRVAPQVKALLYHNPSRPAGHMEAVEVTDRIRTRGRLSVPEAQHYLQAAQAQGFRWEASIGATLLRNALEVVPPGRQVAVNGRQFTGPLIVARSGLLKECSFTGLGGGENTQANLAAAAAIFLQEAKMKHEETSSGDAQAGAADGNSPVIQPAAAPPAPAELAAELKACLTTFKTDVQELIEASQKPIQAQLDAIKRGQISESVDHLAAEYGVSDKALLDDLKGKALEGKAGEGDVKIAILTASAARRLEGFVPAGACLGKDGPRTGEVLEAAYLATCGWSEKELADYGRFDEKTINASLSCRGVGPHALAVEFLRGRGHHVLGGKLRSEDIRAALQFSELPLQAAGGASTISLPGILSNVARKEMLRGYNSVVGAVPRIARRATATDFKPFYMYRLNTEGLLQQIGADGELKSMELKEEEYTSRVYPWGRKLQMTEMMFVNDDAGAFNDLARGFGRLSQITLEKQGITTLLANQATFWTTAKGNRLAAGASSALSIDSLKTAEALFLSFTDGTADENPIGVMPRYLLTGPNDFVTARTINQSSTINIATGDALTLREAVDNPFRGMFEPVMSPYLKSARVPNATETQWLLTADPAETAPIVVAYLDGGSTPQIQTWEKIPGKLGIQWDISFRFGFNAHQDKSSVYSPGA